MSCNINDKKKDLEIVSQGNFEKYNEEVKKKFYQDFVHTTVYRNGKKITAGKSEKEIEKCYEHLTTVGSMGIERIPDLRRYECIYILKDLLSNTQCLNCNDYYVWEKEEGYLKEKIFCPQTGYFIILCKRNYVYKFVSAFFIESKSKRNRLIEEYHNITKK